MNSIDLQPNGNGFAIEPPRTFELIADPPVQVSPNGQVYERMQLQEPNGFQQMTAEREIANGMNPYSLRRYQIALVAQVSGWPVQAVERLPIRRIQEAYDFLAPFTAVGQGTGEN